jgi:hypothetical protein
MKQKAPLQSISDDELLRRLAKLAQQSRRVESDLVAHIAEVDERRLYAREASPSMYAYCTEVLHLSEAEAYLRITAARASRKHPLLLSMLADGRLHLSGIGRLAPHLTEENAEGLLERAVHKSKRQIEELIAELWPRPDVPAVMRRLPAPRGRAQLTGGRSLGEGERESSIQHGSIDELRPDGVSRLGPKTRPIGAAIHQSRQYPASQAPRETSRVPPATVLPLAPGRYRVQFTASAAFRDKLERLRALMLTRVPDGDLATILEEAVREKLERLEARRFATTKVPRKSLSTTDTTPSSRHIPAAIRRAVTQRDGNRCRYVDEQGRRCIEQHRLEFHHRHPFGLGGDHDPRNIWLVCRSHNQHLAVQDYGRRAMERFRGSSRVSDIVRGEGHDGGGEDPGPLHTTKNAQPLF